MPNQLNIDFFFRPPTTKAQRKKLKFSQIISVFFLLWGFSVTVIVLKVEFDWKNVMVFG